MVIGKRCTSTNNKNITLIIAIGVDGELYVYMNYTITVCMCEHITACIVEW